MEEIKWSSLAPPAMLIKILTAIRSFGLIILYFAYRTYQRFDNVSIFNSFDLFLDFLLNILPGILVVISGIMDYKRYLYRLDNEQLHINRGWLRREKKSIPIDKIQSVQIEQNWLYRLLNVFLVKIDTIGEENLEVEIGGVWEQEALDLKSKIQTIQKHSHAVETGSERDLDSEEVIDYSYTLTNSQVSRYAFTENLLWFLLPLSLSIVLLYRLYHSADAENLSWQLVIDLVFGNLDPSGSSLDRGNFSVSYVILYGLLLATFSSGMFFFNKVLGLYNYVMMFQNHEIHISRGLINKFETIIPQRKIQFTTWYTNLLRRKLGIFTMAYKYAGGRKTLGSDAIVPFFDPGIVPQLIKPYITTDSGDESVIVSIDPVYVWRNYLYIKMPLAALVIFLCYWIHPWLFYLSFGVLIYFYVHNYFYVRNFQLHLHKGYFFIHKGVWGRRHTLVSWDKLQKIDLRQTPYQRRNGYAHLYLNTASSNLTIPYLDLKTAQEILDYGLYKTEVSQRFLF